MKLGKERMPSISHCLIILILGMSLAFLYLLGSITQSFPEKSGSTDISLVNSSFVPLSNSNANQVKANMEYSLENEKMQRLQMEVPPISTGETVITITNYGINNAFGGNHKDY